MVDTKSENDVIEVELIDENSTLERVKGFITKHKAGLTIGGAIALGVVAVAVKVILSGDDVFAVDEIIDVETIID